MRKAIRRNILVRGVGVNDADYVVKQQTTIGYREDGSQIKKLVWECPFYRVWVHMLDRCYSVSYHKRHPTYIGCTVVEEWKIFSNFKAWMETQDWQGKQLDKDILLRGNKVYGPETCVFVSSRINSFVIEATAGNGQYPIGVHWDKNLKMFRAMVRVGSEKRRHLGSHLTSELAHEAWLAEKLKIARQLASEIIAEGGDVRIAKAIVDRYEFYEK